MIVYHGTTIESYESIKAEGVIKASNNSMSPYRDIGGMSTTYGYVYLTSKVQGSNGAIDFANRNFIQNHRNSGNYTASMSRKLVIIRLEINDALLEKDMDEDLFGDSACGCCFRYHGDITIENATVRAFEFPSYQDCCDFYDGLTAERVDSWKWKKIGS